MSRLGECVQQAGLTAGNSCEYPQKVQFAG